MKLPLPIRRVPARLSNRLEPPELEAEFRSEGLKRDISVAMGLIFFAFSCHLLSMIPVAELLRGSDALYVVWAVRVSSAALAVGCFLLIRRRSSVAFFDNVIFIWALLLLLGLILTNALLPSDYPIHVAWDLFIAFAAYAVLPLPLGRQAILAAIITASDIVLFWGFKVLEWPNAFIDVLAAFVCVNLVGIFVSWELGRWRRLEFQALRAEAEARVDAEKAWLEVKTLRGIIPICSFCKKVRDDGGYWRQVEEYVRDRTEAEFTHSLCVECVKEHYPEEADQLFGPPQTR